MVRVGRWPLTTLRVAALLVTLPALLLTRQRKRATSSPVTVLVMVKVFTVPPAMSVKVLLPAAARCHWKVTPLGLAPTLKDAPSPTATRASAGWSVMTGAGLLVETIFLTVPLPRCR